MKMNSVNKKKLIGRLNIYRSVLILLVICVFATILSPSFLSVANLFNVFKQITVAGIVGCGMTFVILTGGIDLSVGSILGLAGVLASGIRAARCMVTCSRERPSKSRSICLGWSSRERGQSLVPAPPARMTG